MTGGMKKIIYPGEIAYVGELKNDKPNGNGTLTFPDGRVVEFKDGKDNGNIENMF